MEVMEKLKHWKIYKKFPCKKFWRFVFFCFVGGTSALVGISVFNILFWLGLKFIICQVITIPLAVTYNFFMNRNITFSAKKHSLKKQIPRYAIVYATSTSVNLLTSIIVVNLLGENTLNANIAVICGIAMGIPISFFGSLLWAFKKDQGRLYFHSL